MEIKKKCFVIMPFSRGYKLTKEKWAEIFEHKIKPAVEESGCDYNCERYELRRANITKDIVDELNNAHLVIADLTGSNPNVLWELGVRHTLSKRTILIAQGKKFLPSDLKGYPIILYKYKSTPTEDAEFKKAIKDKLKDIETNPDKPDSPVADFLIEKNIDLLAYEKKANLARLSALISELSYDIDEVGFLIKQIKEAQKIRKNGKQKKPFSTPVRLSNDCLQLFTATQYVILPQKLLNSIRQTNKYIELINCNLTLWPTYGKEVEERLLEYLPNFKKQLVDLMKKINQFKLDYRSDNYLEPKEPCILLAKPEHEEYLKLIE